jgi:DNA-binding transcriptional LysR family regulator
MTANKGAGRVSNARSNWFIRSRLKTRQIALLVQMYTQRSVLKAAQLSGLTQPAASKLLRDLEHSLGVKLFERHARGVQPTRYGEILVRRSRSAMAEFERAFEEIQALKSGLRGEASIGTVLNPGLHLVPLAIAAVKQSHPRIEIKVEMDSSRPLVAKLLRSELDCVIGRILDQDGAEELDFETLVDEPHCLVARAGHLFGKRVNLSLKDLLDLGWILQSKGSVLRDRFDSMLQEQGLSGLKNVVETAALPVAISLLQATDMIAVLPEQAVRPYCTAGLLCILPLALNLKMDAFGIITRRDYLLSPSASVVVNALRETAASIYELP